MPLARAVEQLRRLAAPPPATDRELLTAFARRRDEAAFAELVRRHGPLVRGACRRIAGPGEADDAFQATFLLLARKAGASGWRADVGPWLYATAYRVAAKVRAEAARRQARAAEPHAHVSRSADAPDPLDAAAWRELSRVLDDELAALPERLRAPLVLCYFEGRTQDEAAAQLGWSFGTLRRRLERGRGVLRARLTRRGVTLGAALPAALLTPDAVPATLVRATVAAARTAAGGAMTGWTVKIALGLLLAGGVLSPLSRLGDGGEAVLPPSPGFAGEGMGVRVALPTAPSPPAPLPQSRERGDEKAAALPAGAVARLGTTAFRPGGSATGVVVSPDGSMIASVTDVAVCLWRADTGEDKGRIDAGEFPIRSAAFGAGGKELVVEHARVEGGRIVIYDAVTLERLRTVSVPLARSRRFPIVHPHLVLAPDGRTAIAIHPEQLLYQFDFVRGASGQLVRAHITAVAYSADSRTLYAKEDGKGLRRWDIATGQELSRIESVDRTVADFAVSPDGRWLAAGCGEWDGPLDGERPPKFTREPFLRVWDLTAGREVRQFACTAAYLFTADSRSLITTERNICREFDLASGELRREYAQPGQAVTALALTPDGQTLLTAGYVVRRWDRATGKELPAPAGHGDVVNALTWSPDGRSVLTASADRVIRWWDSVTGRETRRIAAPAGTPVGVSLSASGRWLGMTVRRDDRTDVRMWNTEAGHEFWQTPADGPGVTAFAFGPDSKSVAYADARGTMHVGEPRWGGAGRDFPTVLLNQVCFSHDGRFLYGVAVAPPTAVVLDARTGAEVRRFRLEDPPDNGPVVFSPDGALVANGGRSRFARNPLLRLYDAFTGRETRRFDAVNDEVDCLAFSPDGRRLASAGARWIHRDKQSWTGNAVVTVWDVATGRPLKEFAGHRSARVTALAFSPDGKRLASAAWDTTVLIWDVAE